MARSGGLTRSRRRSLRKAVTSVPPLPAYSASCDCAFSGDLQGRCQWEFIGSARWRPLGLWRCCRPPAAMWRLWDDAKVRMVSGTLVSGGTVNEVARRQGIKANHLPPGLLSWQWRCGHAIDLPSTRVRIIVATGPPCRAARTLRPLALNRKSPSSQALTPGQKTGPPSHD